MKTACTESLRTQLGAITVAKDDLEMKLAQDKPDAEVTPSLDVVQSGLDSYANALKKMKGSLPAAPRLGVLRFFLILCASGRAPCKVQGKGEGQAGVLSSDSLSCALILIHSNFTS